MRHRLGGSEPAAAVVVGVEGGYGARRQDRRTDLKPPDQGSKGGGVKAVNEHDGRPRPQPEEQVVETRVERKRDRDKVG